MGRKRGEMGERKMGEEKEITAFLRDLKVVFPIFQYHHLSVFYEHLIYSMYCIMYLQTLCNLKKKT